MLTVALVAMCSWNTKVNQRTWLLEATLETFRDTVDWSKHRAVFVDNGSEPETGTRECYEKFASKFPFTLIQLPENVGTARAINKAWQLRQPGENAAKVDSDIRITEPGWLCKLEECLSRDPKLGIVALKRPDLIESPWTEGWYKSELKMLPHEPGQNWLVVEKVNHAIGTAQLYSSSLLDKIGYLYQGQGRKYGFDDSLAGIRCMVAGYYSAFYPHYELRHLDPGDTIYQKDKEKAAGEWFGEYHKLIDEYAKGTRSIYYGPNGEQ